MGPVGRASAWVSHRCAHSVPNGGSLHIDAGKPPGAQQYNRFDARFQALKSLSTIRNFTFDTLKTHPYKRGSHGERGVPKRRAYLRRRSLRPKWYPSPVSGLGLPVVRSMHRWLGKGYAGGGERQCLVLDRASMFSSSLVRGSTSRPSEGALSGK